MKKRLRIIATIASLYLCGMAQANVTIEHWKTQGGVPVYFVAKNEIPIVDMAVVFSAGSARDGQQWGLASLTASLLDQGTSHHSADQIARAFDSAGAVFSATASRDSTVVSLRSMRDKAYLDPSLDLYLELLSAPQFSPVELSRVKQQIQDSIKLDAQDPATVATKRLYQTVYDDQAYAHPVSGTRQSLTSLNQKAVKQFYQQFYVSENAKIVMVGDLSRADAEVLANRMAASFPSGKKAAPIKTMQQSGCAKSQLIKMAVSQDAILMGELGIDYHNPDYFDLLVANHVLGGSFMVSILMQELRDKYGYTYGVYSGFSRLKGKGLFRVLLQTRHEKTQAAKEQLLVLLKKYWREGPTPTQLESAKAYLSGSFPLKIASNSAILSQLALIAEAGLPLDYLDHYSQRINAVTASSAKKAFEDHVDLSQLDTIIAGRG